MIWYCCKWYIVSIVRDHYYVSCILCHLYHIYLIFKNMTVVVKRVRWFTKFKDIIHVHQWIVFAFQLYWPRTKFQIFCAWHVQMFLFPWIKCFEENNILMYSQMSMYGIKLYFDSDNGLVPNRCQATTRYKDLQNAPPHFGMTRPWWLNYNHCNLRNCQRITKFWLNDITD